MQNVVDYKHQHKTTFQKNTTYAGEAKVVTSCIIKYSAILLPFVHYNNLMSIILVFFLLGLYVANCMTSTSLKV